MDAAYTTKLALSILIFAPGLILLAMGMFVGFLMVLEKVGLLAKVAPMATDAAQAPAEPRAGAIVDGLNASLENAQARNEERVVNA